jgi:hypothetical protein
MDSTHNKANRQAQYTGPNRCYRYLAQLAYDATGFCLCTLRTIRQDNEPYITKDGCTTESIRVPYALRLRSESVQAWAGERKPEDRALADPNYEATPAADTALGPRFNRAGEEANRRPIPVSS